MLITVGDETGEYFTYDTNKAMECLFPALEDKPRVAAALEEALTFLGYDEAREALRKDARRWMRKQIGESAVYGCSLCGLHGLSWDRANQLEIECRNSKCCLGMEG